MCGVKDLALIGSLELYIESFYKDHMNYILK
jgi:hypothetical protein